MVTGGQLLPFLKILTVFIELGTQGKFVFRAADIFAVFALHCVSSGQWILLLMMIEFLVLESVACY